MPGETTIAEKDSTQETDQTSQSKDGITSKKPQTYTQEQMQKMVSDALAEQGRKHKSILDPVTKERDTFKSQAAEAAATLEETEERIADLEADLEQSIEGNADLTDINKIKKELRAEKEKAKQETKAEREANAELKKALEAERLEWAGTVAEAQAARFEVDAFEVAEEYEGGDSERLKALCEKTGKRKREEIQDLADVLWTKKGKEKMAAMIADSGVTHGGGQDLNNLSIRDLLSKAYAKKK